MPQNPEGREQSNGAEALIPKQELEEVEAEGEKIAERASGIEAPQPPLAKVEAAVDAAAMGGGETVEPADGARVEAESREAELRAEMEADERDYLERYRIEYEKIKAALESETDPEKIGNIQKALKKAKEAYEGLKARYEDEKTGAEYVQRQLEKFAAIVDMDLQGVEFAGKKFNKEQADTVKKRVLEQAGKYFTSEEKGTKNPEKHKIVQEVLETMLNYAAQAIEDNEINQEITAQDVYQLIMTSLVSILYQDRAATENLLGDHGIRHVLGHNVKMCEQIANALAANDQKVSAMDRLMMIQAMIDHDLGYAMDPVRNPINRGGFGADSGHGLLAAKYTREREDLKKIYFPEQIRLLHKMILTHDYTPKNPLTVGDSSLEARYRNMKEIIRIADNTHAFEDKLPELLYAYPNTLTYLKLIEVAITSGGDEKMVEHLKQKLTAEINSSDQFSEDDKKALANAVSLINHTTAQFTVGRICGHKPEIAVDSTGRVIIEVEESKIHQMVIGTFGQESLAQLKKFVTDLTGQPKEQVDFNVDEIADNRGVITIKVKTRGKLSDVGPTDNQETTRTDYQNAVEEIITDAGFQSFLATDNFLAAQILDNERKLENVTDEAERDKINASIAEIKAERIKNLKKYLGIPTEEVKR